MLSIEMCFTWCRYCIWNNSGLWTNCTYTKKTREGKGRSRICDGVILFNSQKRFVPLLFEGYWSVNVLAVLLSQTTWHGMI